MTAALSLPSVAVAGPRSSAAVAEQTETLVVRVNLNSQNKGDFFVQRSPDHDFLLKVEDLKAMGFRNPTGAVQLIDGEPHLSLRAMPGVTFAFDEKTLALNIAADPKQLPSRSFDLRAERHRGALVESGNSAFLNYALTNTRGSLGSGNGLDFAGEAGLRWGDYLLLSDATTVDTIAGRRLVRLTSSVTRDDRANLRRTVIGDLQTPSRDFSSSVNLGGIGISKLYGIDPYFVRFPTQSLNGSVTLPSDMEVYLDGQRVRTERLAPGEFELRDILAFGGSRDLQIVLRDPFGRVQQLNYSLYFTDQPLQEGLHEYSYNFGAIRRQFGIRSNSYGPAAFTMFHRYGFNRAVTPGWRAEATRELLNTGPTATVVLGAFGVANLSLAASQIAGRHGIAGQFSYTFQSKSWTLGAFLRHDGRDYASIGDPPMMTNRRYEGNVSATYRLPHNASLSLSHTALTTRALATALTAGATQPFTVLALSNRRATALSYSTPLPAIRAQLTTTLSRINDSSGPNRTEVFLSLNFILGSDYSASASYRADQQDHSESLRFTKSQPIGEGLGYDVTLDRSSAPTRSTQLRSDIQYNAPAAVLRADYGEFRDKGQLTRDERVSVAGGIMAVGGHVAMSRPVTQSYAIVKVGDVPDVGVAVDGLPVGKTNSEGIAVIPNLNAYYENSVSIASKSLPMDYALPAEVKRVSPSLRAGTFIDFGVTKVQGFSGKLFSLIGGIRKPVEFAEINMSVGGRAEKLPTGRGGEFYLENLKPGTYKGAVSFATGRCSFELTIPRSEEMLVDVGEIPCRPSR